MTKCYGYCMKFGIFIQTTWYKTFFSAKINGYFLGPFPTRCSITQVSPLSKILFAVILNPLIYLCHVDRLVGQIDYHAGQHILSGNKHNCFQINNYSSPFKEYHLIVDESKVKSLARDPKGRHLCRNIEYGMCIPYYSPRYGTQYRFSQPRWSTSDKS